MVVDLEARRAELLDLRARIAAAAESLVAGDADGGEINTAAGDQHLADHASEIFDRELDSSLEENAEHILAEIDDALARIDEGRYGTCVVCGDPIPEERLDAVPYATLCVRDKRLQERS